MGWMYMLVCTMDFVGFPILWSLLQGLDHGNVSSQWQPLTLQGAGLFHIAMGAVIGISAYGRTQEKLGGAAGPSMNFPQGAGTTYVPPGQGNVQVNNQAPAPAAGGFGGTSNGGFGSNNSSFGGAPAFGAAPTSGFGAPAATPAAGGFGSVPAASTAPAPAAGFGASTAPAVVSGFGGKPGPAPQVDPVI